MPLIRFASASHWRWVLPVSTVFTHPDRNAGKPTAIPEAATVVVRLDFKKCRLVFVELGWTIIYPFELRFSEFLLI